MSFENANYQWQQGERRMRAAPPEQLRLLERVADAIVAELRRRLGGRFSSEELVELYERGTVVVPADRDARRAAGSVGVGRGASCSTPRSAATCARLPTTQAAGARSP